MSLAVAIETAFLTVSCAAVVIQSAVLRRLLCRFVAESPVHRGLVRTSVCRVFAMSVYVLLGVNALWTQFAVLQLTFGVFAGTTTLWIINGIADVRLKRHLDGPGCP